MSTPVQALPCVTLYTAVSVFMMFSPEGDVAQTHPESSYRLGISLSSKCDCSAAPWCSLHTESSTSGSPRDGKPAAWENWIGKRTRETGWENSAVWEGTGLLVLVYQNWVHERKHLLLCNVHTALAVVMWFCIRQYRDDQPLAKFLV